MKESTADALRFLGFVLILFVFVNNLISVVLDMSDLTSFLDVALLMVFYGIVATLVVVPPEED